MFGANRERYWDCRLVVVVAKPRPIPQKSLRHDTFHTMESVDDKTLIVAVVVVVVFPFSSLADFVLVESQSSWCSYYYYYY